MNNFFFFKSAEHCGSYTSLHLHFISTVAVVERWDECEEGVTTVSVSGRIICDGTRASRLTSLRTNKWCQIGDMFEKRRPQKSQGVGTWGDVSLWHERVSRCAFPSPVVFEPMHTLQVCVCVLLWFQMNVSEQIPGIPEVCRGTARVSAAGVWLQVFFNWSVYDQLI